MLGMMKPTMEFTGTSSYYAYYGDGVDGAPTGIDCAKMVVVRNPIS
jgi:hypothetical protein